MDWLQWFINFLIKKYLAPGESVRNEVISNEELAKELHKPVIRKFDKRKLHSPFIDIVSPDPADIQSIKNLDFYCVLLIFIANILALFFQKIKKYYDY